MVPLASLWLPVLLSSVIVFFASFILHMVLPWHKHDYARLPDEERVRSALRPFAIPPGDYMVPRPQTGEEMRGPEFAARVAEGPNIVMTVLPNAWSMTRNLGMWFVYLVVVAIFAGYVAGRRRRPRTTWWCSACWHDGVRWLRPCAVADVDLVSPVVGNDDPVHDRQAHLSSLVAGTFGWLWPT
jgi:hypothetical protein